MPNSTTVPGFTLLKAGAEISSEQVYSVHVEFGASTIPKATVYLNDGSWALQNFPESEKTDWQIGDQMEIKIGYQQQHETVFSGLVTKMGITASEQSISRMYIELRHELYKSAIKKNSRVFLDKKDSEIIEEIGSELGFNLQIDSSISIHQQMIQFNSSNWDFINMRAQACGMFVFPKNQYLTIQQKVIPTNEKITLKFGSNIAKVDLEMDSRNCFENYQVSSWNTEDQDIINSEPNLAPTPTVGTVSAEEIAKRASHGTAVTQFLGSIEESEAVEKANYRKISAELSKVIGTVKCVGNNDVEIGDWIKLEGLGNQFNGKVLVSGVLHELSAGRWYTSYQIGTNPKTFAEQFTDITAEPAAGLLPSVHGLQIGIVSTLEDPNGGEKILIQLPNLRTGTDAVWARCSRMDAGKDRGWIYRPEIGDEVILGFINDDPRQAIILGSMHSSKNISPVKAEDSNHHKGYISRENLKLLFDDEKKKITITTPDATIELDDDQKKITLKNSDNTVELSDAGTKIETQKDLTIKASGDVKIEGTNISLKASANLESEGSAGVKLSSSAVTNIKGSIVNINS